MMRYLIQDVCSYYIGEEQQYGNRAGLSIIKPPPSYSYILVSIIGLQIFKLTKFPHRFGSIRFDLERNDFNFECQFHVSKAQNASWRSFG